MGMTRKVGGLGHGGHSGTGLFFVSAEWARIFRTVTGNGDDRLSQWGL
jgi:hypothetical protein